MTGTSKHPDKSLLESILDGIQEVKGHEIVVLDLRKIPHAVSDYFIVCHGDSNTQVQAIARAVESMTKKDHQQGPWHVEGVRNASWILMDYSDIVVHIFYKDSRAYYALEELWEDAEKMQLENRA